MLHQIVQTLLYLPLGSQVTKRLVKQISINLRSLRVFCLCREISLKAGVATGSIVFINNSLSGDNPLAAVETYAKRSFDR